MMHDFHKYLKIKHQLSSIAQTKSGQTFEIILSDIFCITFKTIQTFGDGI